MNWKMFIALTVVTLAVAAPLPTAVGDEPAVEGDYVGRQKFVQWKIGVEGSNTRDGYVISKVYVGYPANRLGRDRGFTLEKGDRITEVNGNLLDRNWTLQKALGYSGGTINFTYWDDRQCEFRSFRGVKLVR